MSSTVSFADRPGSSPSLPWRSRDTARPAPVGTVLPLSRPGTAQSRSERALENASAFWLAAADRTLVSYLQPDPIDRLSAARTAFAKLGLVRVADRLDQAISEILRGPPQQPSSVLLSKLEQELPSSRDLLSELTACFAAEYAARRHQSTPGDVSGHVTFGGDGAAVVEHDRTVRRSPPGAADGATTQ